MNQIFLLQLPTLLFTSSHHTRCSAQGHVLHLTRQGEKNLGRAEKISFYYMLSAAEQLSLHPSAACSHDPTPIFNHLNLFYLFLYQAFLRMNASVCFAFHGVWIMYVGIHFLKMFL